ncbi:MAG: O-antigen ligase family protein [bacterium]
MSSLPTVIAVLLILVAPLGVAGQNIGLGLSLLIFAVFSIYERGRRLRAVLKSPVVAQFFLIWFVTLFPSVVTTLAKGQLKEAGRFLLGYVLVTPMFVLGLALRDEIRSKVIKNISTIILVLLSIISLSQFLTGWQLAGLTVTEQIKRAQGFYSHPLTLAYASLCIMPLICARALAKPRDWSALLSGLALLVMIATSQSLTVISLTAVTLTFLSIKLLTRKKMLALGLIATTLGIVALSTPNPISQKFQTVLAGQRSDHETPYPDDRLAFWHAHWEMFKDAPIVGHGTDITREDRKPYYERIGLGHIKRMYEAHNMYLQAAVEGGLVAGLGLLTFLIWWFLHARNFKQVESWQRLGAMITPLAFAAGGLTQNAIQDSEVRYLLILSCTFCFAISMPSHREKN